MSESLKSLARRYAKQQNAQYPDIIIDAVPDKNVSSVGLKMDGVSDVPVIGVAGSGQQEQGVNKEWMGAASLTVLEQMICECQKCPLGATRTKFVFGVGDPKADIVVIGEAPGADEDQKGEPFVGQAGKLLNKILASVGFEREQVFICNVLKCRPPGNRTPEPNEVQQCSPFLRKQLDLIKPKFILALGLSAANTLLGTKSKMSDLRGSVREYYGIPLIVTYHPAALLRNPNWKRATWEDVQTLRKLYDESR